MVGRVMAQFNFQDTEVEEFFRKGLLETSFLTQHGAILSYREELSGEEAALLRRMLSTRPPVRKLVLGEISHDTYRIAFDGLEEVPSLREIIFQCIDCKGKDLDIAVCQVFRSLRSLDLKCVKAGSGFGKDVASYIRQNKSLEELRLAHFCGGDEGIAAIIDALRANDTLKKFTLDEMEPLASFLFSGEDIPQLSSEALTGFAEMLASNSSLELVDVRGAFPVEKDKVSSLLAQERHAGVFKRICIEWPEQLLPELTELLRKEACYPKLHVSVSTSVDGGIVRELFDAAASHKALLELHFSSTDDTDDFSSSRVNEVAEGIVSVLKRTRTLRKIYNTMDADYCHLISIFDALKGNRSVTKVSVEVGALDGELVKSLSECLAVNKTLNLVDISAFLGGWPRELEKITEALRTNYTLTRLYFDSYWVEYPRMPEKEALLQRNVRLMERAAEFVLSGADVSDEEGVDALKKVQASASLVERVLCITGETEEAAMETVLSALARVSV